MNRFTCDQTPSAADEEAGFCFEFYSTLLVHEKMAEEMKADCIDEGNNWLDTNCPENDQLMMECVLLDATGVMPGNHVFYYSSGSPAIDEFLVTYIVEQDMVCCPGPAYPL